MNKTKKSVIKALGIGLSISELAEKLKYNQSLKLAKFM
jgi:hypothetical protein